MSITGYGHCETYRVPCRESQHREFYWLDHAFLATALPGGSGMWCVRVLYGMLPDLWVHWALRNDYKEK